MNDPLNSFEEICFIFTLTPLAVSASLTEAIPNRNTDLIERHCSWTRAIRVASKRKFVSYNKTLASVGCGPVDSCSSFISNGSDECRAISESRFGLIES